MHIIPSWNQLKFNFLSETVYNKTTLAGDFNGKSPQWGYTRQDNSGKTIEELCESTHFTVLQDQNSTPTLLHRAHNTLHRPELTILSSDLIYRHTIEIIDDMGSDYSPIYTTVFPSEKKNLQEKN